MPKTSRNEQPDTAQLTFSLPDHPVRISPSPASEREWMERVATYPSDLLSLLGRYGPAGCCSKTSLGFLAPLRTKRRVLVYRRTIYSQEKNGSLKTTMKLTKGVISDTSYPRFWNSGILSHTQCWTLSTSGWRSGAAVCSLWEVLETGEVHRRYYSTSKACRGLLRRAEKRGKTLPEHLARALRAVAGLEPTSNLGGVIPLQHSRLAGSESPEQERAEGKIPSLQCFGGNRTSGKIEVAAGLARGGRKDFETETFVTVAHSLRAEGFDASEDGTGRGTPLIVTAFSQKDSGADATEDLAPTLRAMSHDGSHANGGGQVAIAFDPTQITSPTNRSKPQEEGDPCHTLAKGAAPPVIAFTERGREQGRTFEAQEELAYALCNPGSGGRTHSRQVFTVRRLTPIECERLQGFPDGYTAVQHKRRPAADGPRYKALGNSMAVPVIAWIGRRIYEVENLVRRGAC